jgi:hypothetical protein
MLREVRLLKTNAKNDLVHVIEIMAKEYPDSKLIISSHPNGCPDGHSKVYIRLRKGKSGGVVISRGSECMPDSEAEKYKKTIRSLIRTKQ